MSNEIEYLVKQAKEAKTYSEAVEWYKKAAELGDLESLYQIGYIYYYNFNPQLPEEGASWWHKAALLGHSKSQRTYGWYLLYGIHPNEEQEKEAWEWYRKAAENGDAEAQKKLAGQCNWERKYDEAERWWTMAAEQGDIEAQIRLAKEYYKGYGLKQDYDKAMFWWEKAAENGDQEAAYQVGYSYYSGDCIKQDFKEALKWLGRAAASGHSEAKFILARCYENGWGTKKDLSKAKMWYASAASQGHEAAKRRHESLTIDEQPDKADKWSQKGRAAYDAGDIHAAFHYYMKAAEAGDAFAQYSIGFFYYDGQGVRQNRAEAKMWLEKAAKQGHKHAKALLKNL